MGDSRDIEQNIEFDILNYVIVIDTLKQLINQYRILKGPNFQKNLLQNLLLVYHNVSKYSSHSLDNHSSSFKH